MRPLKNRPDMLGALIAVLGLILLVVLGWAISPSFTEPPAKVQTSASLPPKPEAQLGGLGGPQAKGEADLKEDHDLLNDRLQQMQREHTDSSGKVRPDLWQKGIEDFKKLPVVTAV